MSSPEPRVVLKRGREAAVLRRHPWVFSGSVGRVQGSPDAGALVSVLSHAGEFLAWGHYSPHSQIRVRLFSWTASRTPDTPEFWRSRLSCAIQLRAPLLSPGGAPTTCGRLVYAESDGIPGLIVDRYADTVVMQALTVGIERRKALFADLLWDVLEANEVTIRSLYERSDVDGRDREGLKPHTGLLRGDPPAERILIRENGLGFWVDVRGGHKTGFYLDQRENRLRMGDLVRRQVDLGRPPVLLNAFAYTGGFAVYGLEAGARSVVNIDTSGDALAIGQANFRLNDQDTGRVEDVEGDVFEVLRRFRDEGREFDMVVLDPPKFAHTQRDVQGAARGYKDINLQAIHLLRPGGLLLTFSCSGAISDDLFQKIVFGAALDTGREVQIVGRLMQADDHPVALTFPEGAYLKGLVCRVVA
ncbi:MAG: class I SAM-dependent rRNA methyltransferase [Anaerolineae bacterium]